MHPSPKQKAKELFDYYDELLTYIESKNIVKQCAIKVADDILNMMIKDFKWNLDYNGNIHYWQEVKKELELL